MGEWIMDRGFKSESVAGRAAWATASALWEVFGAEGVSKITDNVITNRNDLSGWDVASAATEVPGGKLVKGAMQGVSATVRVAGKALGKGAETTTALVKTGKRTRKTSKAATGTSSKVADDGRTFVTDPSGNTLIVPKGGKVTGSPDGKFVQTRRSDGSIYQRKDQAHRPPRAGEAPSSQKGTAPHGHGMDPDGNSLDVHGNVVDRTSPEAHWDAK